MKHGHQNPVARPDGQISRMRSETSFDERTHHQFTGGLPEGLDPKVISGRPTSFTQGTIKHTVTRKRRQHDRAVVQEEAE
jgi:hypothetical protein